MPGSKPSTNGASNRQQPVRAERVRISTDPGAARGHASTRQNGRQLPHLILYRTGRRKRFLLCSIGEVFYHSDRFWTRTDTYAGTEVLPGRHGSTFRSACSFGNIKGTLLVDEVKVDVMYINLPLSWRGKLDKKGQEYFGSMWKNS